MKLVVLAVGRLKDPAVRALSDDYLGRLRRYTPCEEREVKSGSALRAATPEGALAVALDPRGEVLTSEAFARRVEQWASRNKGVVAFWIGGADGIPAGALATADFRMSLSTLTLPHRLARVVLLEQLYRAMTILRGEPYSH